ncbi:hypothetical protein SAMN04488065_0586 [Haloplanus vescus]|uniref:DUF8009 domain-containing protein n=1 Tax=Haloplanus vescus TaxID=555874 RepID=A0A1H3W5M0_9EURY|nr:hypothetical protein [Haloplanus vescus]SDZ82377.1 hypothetical protein SAMN04488065_0586 [Haloplanus vescus]
MAPTTGTDPTAIVAVAVTADDVVTALEATRRGGRRTVLRVTPPFSGRMRARLHRPRDGDETDALHLDPTELVAQPPPYPDPDATADRLRERGAYSTERHHARHAEAVREWRAAVRDAIVDAVTIDTESGPHRIEVTRLG